jgi:hypothetical protein
MFLAPSRLEESPKMENVRHALTLGQGDMLRITDGRGLLVQVAQGKVWLTQERDYRDIVLGAGESFRLERAGLSLVYALEAAALSVAAPRERERAEPAGTFGVVPARAA